jgi:hypothetical protein
VVELIDTTAANGWPMLVAIDTHCARPSGDANCDEPHVPFVSKNGTVRSGSATSTASAVHAPRASAPLLRRMLVLNTCVAPATLYARAEMHASESARRLHVAPTRTSTLSLELALYVGVRVGAAVGGGVGAAVGLTDE